MAGQTIVEFIVERAIQVVPPIVWGLVILVAFIAYMLISRFSRGGSIHVGMILILALSTLLGGVFTDFFRPVMFALAVGALFYGGWNYFTR